MKKLLSKLMPAALAFVVLLTTACAVMDNNTSNEEDAFDCSDDLNDDTQTAAAASETDSESSSITLNNTYVTRYAEVNHVTAPEFAFDYSDNWTVTREDVSGTEIVQETVVLTDSNGATITYMKFWGNLGGYGKNMSKYEITKAADSQFVPGYPAGTDSDLSSLGDFMVGRIETTGSMMSGLDDDYIPVSDTYNYAVMPETYIGTYETMGLAGFQEMVAFDYPTHVAFYATRPEGGFTDDELDEVIAILSSFRVN